MVTSKSSWAAVVAIGILAVSGCSSAPENLKDLEAATKTNQKHIDKFKSWVLPSEDAEKARAKFAQRCVEKRGGTYLPQIQPHSIDQILGTNLTVDDAKDHGYQLAKDADRTPLDSSDKAGQKAYFGDAKNGTASATLLEYSSGDIPTDGCMAESLNYIYGSVEDGLKAAELAPSFVHSVRDKVLEDDEYTKLQEKWSQCMNDAGYPNLTDTNSAVTAANNFQLDEQKRQATADAQCREDISFNQSVNDLAGKYYESAYKRVKNVGSELERIHETASKRVEEDKNDPKSSAPVTSQPSASNS